jgi:hypothetical protein
MKGAASAALSFGGGMKSAICLRTFRRSDNRKIVRMNERIEGEGSYIDELCRNRMVREVMAISGSPENKGTPTEAAGGLSSASQAAQASPRTTAISSGDGVGKAKRDKRKKAAESS